MHTRRTLLASAITGLGLLDAGGASAYERCGITPMGPLCEAGVPMEKLPTIYASQQLSQWCWAASLSMIFRFYGYRVDQEEIVRAAFGRVVNLPAFSGSVISAQLNRVWTDRNGARFRSRISGLFDADAGIVGLSNERIIATLIAGRPLLMGTVGHAMVLTAVAFARTPGGPRIVNLGLLDPWPGVGIRGARDPGEMVPMSSGGQLRYLALPEVRAI